MMSVVIAGRETRTPRACRYFVTSPAAVSSFDDGLRRIAYDRNHMPRAGEQMVALLRAGHHFVNTQNEDQLLDAVLEYLPAATMTERPDGEIEDAEDDYDRLSTREKQVFKLVAEGKTSRDIAKYLGISLKTAMTHRTHIMEKLAMHSRSEIMRYAIRKAIIPPEEV